MAPYLLPFHRVESFYEKIAVFDEDKCWLWKAKLAPKGRGNPYGYFGVGDKTYRVHRLMWELYNDRPIPDKMVVRHKCDNTVCVNPRHLELGTQKQNVYDMLERGRSNHRSGLGMRGKSILTEDKIEEIQGLHAMGMSRRKIAAKCGVSIFFAKIAILGRNRVC